MCDGLNKKKCKKQAGCTYKKKQCIEDTSARRALLQKKKKKSKSAAPPPAPPAVVEAVFASVLDCGEGFPSSPFTIEAFVYASTAAEYTETQRLVTAEAVDASEFSVAWHLSIRRGSPVFGYVADDEVEEVAAPSRFELRNRWQHIAVSVGDGAIVLYQEGVEVARAAMRGEPAAASNIQLGGYASRAWEGAEAVHSVFDGLIDEVRVFSGVRSAADILSYVGVSGTTAQMPTLQRLYNVRFDPASSSIAPAVLRDATGNSGGCTVSPEAYAAGYGIEWLPDGSQSAGLELPAVVASPPPAPIELPSLSPPPAMATAEPPLAVGEPTAFATPPAYDNDPEECATPPSRTFTLPGGGMLPFSGASGCSPMSSPFGSTSSYMTAYEHARLDGHGSFGCQTFDAAGDGLTLTFSLKPARAFTGAVAAMLDGDGDAFMTIGIQTGGWLEARVLSDEATGRKLGVTLKEPALASGDRWTTCSLVLSGSNARLACGTASVSEDAANDFPLPDTAALIIGAHEIDASGDGFEGEVDDVRVWSKALRTSQIQVNRDNELVGDEDGLAAYYRMGEELEGTTVLDATGHGAACEFVSTDLDTPAASIFVHVPLTERRLYAPEPKPALTKDGGRRRSLLQTVPPAPASAVTLAPEGAKATCAQILAETPALEGLDGQRVVALPDGAAQKVYCDMTRFGGGWTLLVNNAGGGGFTQDNVLRRYPANPNIMSDYSNLAMTDTILAAGATGRPWHYMVEVVVKPDADAAVTESRGAVYSAPANSSLIGGNSKRTSVSLVERFGEWRASPLGLQDLLPTVVTDGSDDDETHALLSTGIRPLASPWGALVNAGELPDACNAATTFFDACVVNTRLWVREAGDAPVEEPEEVTVSACDLALCESAATNQCKQAQCLDDGTCAFELNKPDGTACDDGDSSTHLDECDAGVCLGYTLVSRQVAPLTPAQVERAASGERVGDADASFVDAAAIKSLSSRRGVNYALHWPGTRFSTQTWTQKSYPWESRTTSKARGFAARKVTLVGFAGLVGDGGDELAALAQAPAVGLKVGAARSYFDGLPGPGVLPVDTIELYAREVHSDGGVDETATWTITVITVLVVTLAGLLLLSLRRMRKRGEDVKMGMLSGLSVAAGHLGIPMSERVLEGTGHRSFSGSFLASPTARAEAALIAVRSEVCKNSTERWGKLRKQFEAGSYPFRPHMRHRLVKLLRRYLKPDGRLDRNKLQRLEVAQRVTIKRSQGASLSERLKDELFLISAYVFDTLSPGVDAMGKFWPVLSPLVCMVIFGVHSFMAGQYTTYQTELRYRECEAEQAIAAASRAETQALLAQVTASAALALESANAAQVTAALVANATIAEEIDATDRTIATLTAMSDNQARQQQEQGGKQGDLGNDVFARVHDAHRAQDRVGALEAELDLDNLSREEQVMLEQARADKDRQDESVKSLFDEVSALDSEMQAGRDLADNAETVATLHEEKQQTRISAAQGLADLQIGQAQVIASGATDQLDSAAAATAAANDLLDPWAAVGTLDASLLASDAAAVALLEAKLSAVSGNGYGAVEHTCELFAPTRASPGIFESSLHGFSKPFDAEYLVRWGARYVPSLLEDDEGYRWIASTFVHGSWSQLSTSMLVIGVVGILLERRYGSLRFLSVFVLSALGANFVGALADSECDVVTGATGATFGLMAFYVLDAALCSFHAVAPPTIFAWSSATLVSLIQIAAAFTGGSIGHLTNFGGFVTGLVVSTIMIPHFVQERLEVLVLPVTAIGVLVVFAVLPAVFYVQSTPYCAEQWEL